MEFKNLVVEVENNIAVVTVNRPEKLNALNNETIEELDEVFSQLNENEDVYVIILTGSGDKAFVAGADISELNNLDEQKAKIFSEKGQKVFSRIEKMEKPVIAAVNGYALGGGCEIALACNIRLGTCL